MSTEGKRNFRPKVHFSPKKGWMNDPNGMVYINGTYHFCYQYYPNGTEWGPMHWGHAVSTDLIHWEDYPTALYPDELGWIFSGSSVYDTKNTSGYGTEEQPPIISMYTSHHHKTGLEQQSIAYSTDGGFHFEKSIQNPVIPNPGIADFRDPKMFWNPIEHCWGVVLAAYDRAFFYASKDLKEWEKTGEFGPEGNHVAGVWECPDLFQVSYGDKTIWVLVVSMTKSSDETMCRTQYFLGDFNGKEFVCTYPADEPLWIDAGIDNYAGVTFQNTNERLFMSWGMNWQYAKDTPTNEYCGQATLARSLHAVDTKAGVRLVSVPVGLEKYQSNARTVSNGTHLRTETFGLKIRGNGDGKLVLRNAVGQKMVVEVKEGKILVDRSCAGYSKFNDFFMTQLYSSAETKRLTEGSWDMELIFDVSIMELFAEGGLQAFSMVVYPDAPYDKIIWEGDLQVELYEIG